MSATLSQLQLSQAKHKAAGGQFLGSVIGWRVNNTVRLDHSTLTQLANQSGIPSHLLPAAVKSSQAFRKAIHKVRGSAQKQGFLLRYISDSKQDEKTISVGLVEETADIDKQKLDYDYLGLIKYKEDDFSSTIQGHDELLAELRQQFQFYQAHTSDDIYKILTNFAKKYSIRLTPHGGCYFVPSSYQSILVGIQHLIKDCDSENLSKVFVFELYDSPQNQSDLAETTTNNLEIEIQELTQDLENFLQTVNPERKTFDKGIKSRSQAVKDLTARVEAFAKVLDFQAEALYSKLNEVQQMLDLRTISLKPIKSSHLSIVSSNLSPEQSLTVSTNFVAEAGF